MLSSVTPSTIAALNNEALSSGLGLTSSVVLIILLIAKELAGAGIESTDNPKGVALSRAIDYMLNVPIIPLLIVLMFSVVARVIEVLQ
ncbi:MAG TPA: hypothetical protein GXX21_03505 [Syntrophomonadaceae bacterium]|nr:hypothetical protein [Syntrophomonadaceae bacterium]